MPESPEYTKNTKEQYEALGRFVEAFEAMVHEARADAIDLVARDDHQADLVSIALHHRSLTAKPIFDIFRAVVAEILSWAISLRKIEHPSGEIVRPILKGKPLDITHQDQEALMGALNIIASEYDDLQTKRNNLLHATWFIGYESAGNREGARFEVMKLTASATGLSRIAGLPENATDLATLVDRCEMTRTWIASVHACLAGTLLVADTFKREGSEWCLFIGSVKLPLRKK